MYADRLCFSTLPTAGGIKSSLPVICKSCVINLQCALKISRELEWIKLVILQLFNKAVLQFSWKRL